MEYAPQVKCFKNSSTRNFFTKEVLSAFEQAQSHVELITLYQNFEQKFLEMQASEEEYDQLAYTIIHARYQALHERIDTDRAWIRNQVIEFEMKMNNI